MTKYNIRTVFIHEIARQYKEHNEPIPPWLHIGDIEFDLDKPSGKWIGITNKKGSVIALRCSYCNESPKHAIRSDYCPNCGAKMESEE